MPPTKYDWESIIPEAEELVKSGRLEPTYQALAKHFGIPKPTVHSALERNDISIEAWGAEAQQFKSKISISEDGSQVSERLIWISEEDSKKPERLLEMHGYDPLAWEMLAATNNYWNMPGGDGTLLVCYQSKIRARPKKEIGITLSSVDEFFANFSSDKKSTIQKPKNTGNRILEIALADMHFHSLASDGNDSDIKSRFRATAEDIYNRITPNIGKVVLVPLGDYFHYDTFKKTTTHGTAVDVVGMSFKEMFDAGASLLIWFVDRLAEKADVEILHIPGNHDRMFSYALIKALEFYYRNNSHVTVDAGHSSRKWRVFGSSLVGWTHGDMVKKNISSWLQKEAREEWGNTKFAEVHAGHFHTQTTIEHDGLIVRYLPTFSPTDQWHYDKGYVGNVKSTACFVWDEELGLREIWFANVVQ